jgi:hypothetical protein
VEEYNAAVQVILSYDKSEGKEFCISAVLEVVMKRGELVTTAKLLDVFKIIKVRLNEISSVQIAGLSIGQILGIGVDTNKPVAKRIVVNTLMSTTTEQYFDSSVNIVYYLPEDDGSSVHGGEKWFEYWLEEIRKLEEI